LRLTIVAVGDTQEAFQDILTLGVNLVALIAVAVVARDMVMGCVWQG